MDYVFDNNTLTAIFRHYYYDRFPSFWTKFNQLISENRICSVREVRREIEILRRGDSLEEWMKQHTEFFETPDIEELNFITEIYKIPQIGHVEIGNNVEIGANTTVDRAAIGKTFIGDNTKIDNLVMVAHNCEIGENTVIAAQTGISGSVKVGKSCMMGGQVGIAGHITIADKTMIGAQAGVISTIKDEGRSIIGSPAIDARDYMKAYAIFKNLHKQR